MRYYDDFRLKDARKRHSTRRGVRNLILRFICIGIDRVLRRRAQRTLAGGVFDGGHEELLSLRTRMRIVWLKTRIQL